MNKQNFTRNRKLPFSKMVLLMMKKGLKSIQNTLNETQIYLSSILEEDLETISKSAYTKAREKLNYTAFIELYEDIRDMFYKHYDYSTYRGFRCLAIDGSIITLPYEENIKKEFSLSHVKNQFVNKNKTIIQARVSVLYDVLNNIVIDALLADKKTHEISISKNNHFKHLQKNDLILFDRGYPSLHMFATITYKYNAHYLARMKRNMYKKYTKALFDKHSNIKDIVVTLKPSTEKVKQELIKDDLPLEVKVRLIRVVLDDGEIEVLATSVLDKDILPLSTFKELYFKRWGVETYYALLKERLTLENFSGKTTLSVKQDFYSSIFISNIEALAVYELNEKTSEEVDSDNLYKKEIKLENKSKSKTNKYIYKINKSVSLNVIKNYCFDMFYSDKNMQDIVNDMKKLMIKDKVPIRNNRHFSRNKNDSKNTRGIKSSNYHRRSKKVVF